MSQTMQIRSGSPAVTREAMKRRKARRWTLFYLTVMIGLVFSETISFPMMPQAYAMYLSNPNPFYWFQIGHLHAIRLLNNYPAIVMSDILGTSIDISCSLQTAMMFSGTYFFIGKTTLLLTKKNYTLTIIIQLIPMLILPFLMNGRLAFAFLGYSIVIFSLLNMRIMPNKTIRSVLGIITGVLLCAVTTGTLFISLITSTVDMLKQKVDSRIHKKRSRFFFWIFVIAILSYALSLIEKLFFFFGEGWEGISGILQHGYGRIFGQISISVAGFAVTVIFMILVAGILFYIAIKYLLIKRSWTERECLYFVIVCPILGMVVGYSTGLLFIVPSITLCNCVVANAVKKGI